MKSALLTRLSVRSTTHFLTSLFIHFPLLFGVLTLTERSLGSQELIDQICSIEAQYGHSPSGAVVSSEVASLSTLGVQPSVASTDIQPSDHGSQSPFMFQLGSASITEVISSASQETVLSSPAGAQMTALSTPAEATASTTLGSPKIASATSTPSKSAADCIHKGLSLEYIITASILLSLLQ